MNFINALTKFISQVLNPKEKEVRKMTKKILAIAVVMAVALAYTVAPAMAYTVIGGGAVSITASGAITGNTVTFAASVVDAKTGTTDTDYGSTLTFPSNPAGKTNSGKALKITGGSNVAGTRIIIGTDNNALFTDSTQDPRQKPDPANPGKYLYSGSDGSGMIGIGDSTATPPISANQGYVVSLYWGVSTTDPNTNAPYTFGTSNWSWIVDKWHNHTYVPTLSDGITVDPNFSALDTASFYKVASTTAETNALNEGTGTYKKLYPSYWDQDLYDAAFGVTGRKVYTVTVVVSGVSTDYVVGQALYKNIATIAYGIQAGSDSILVGGASSAGYFVCQVNKFGGTVPNNFTWAKLKKTDGTAGSFIYVPIGGDFTGIPAQKYSTSALFVAMVQDS